MKGKLFAKQKSSRVGDEIKGRFWGWVTALWNSLEGGRVPADLENYLAKNNQEIGMNKGSPGHKNLEIMEFGCFGLPNNKTEILLDQNEAEYFARAFKPIIWLYVP